MISYDPVVQFKALHNHGCETWEMMVEGDKQDAWIMVVMLQPSIEWYREHQLYTPKDKHTVLAEIGL